RYFSLHHPPSIAQPISIVFNVEPSIPAIVPAAVHHHHNRRASSPSSSTKSSTTIVIIIGHLHRTALHRSSSSKLHRSPSPSSPSAQAPSPPLTTITITASSCNHHRSSFLTVETRGVWSEYPSARWKDGACVECSAGSGTRRVDVGPMRARQRKNTRPSGYVQHDFPKKKRDPGGFIIQIALGNGKVASGMLDLGAGINLIPFSIFQRLGLGDLRLTRMCLQLADRSIRYPKGIVEDVLMKVGKLIIPVDFIVLVGDVHENGKDHTILLGRPFMATTNTLIDVKNDNLNMTVLGELVSISIREAMSSSSVNFVEECAFIDLAAPF
ncbi:Unknown protein, partial [Striga hermonthica]